ncbi:hypothetical protein [Modestobacter sp. Leaf380]|uniref:hypothetical protein n=1 Tax=Modestobacter sp. Leaf380 TaxID=1736356 RepID=UPI0006FE7DB2|nr:hypothetical protein [Modestobacter sp. Leaf380]KQS68211.1 hypothetical protein ASG41_04115 [Modestobacter sp. Leaf380]
MTDPLIDRLTHHAPADLDTAELSALLTRARARVDAGRTAAPRSGARRLRPRTRLALVAAAAAVLTAVPIVVDVVGQDEDGTAPPGLSLAVAVAQNGEFACANGFATAVDPAQAEVRLLPDELPPGWEYSEIFVRHERSQNCDVPSLVALQLDSTGVVTGRLAIRGPVEAYVNAPVVDRDSVPDTVFGASARRFDYAVDPAGPIDAEIHRWLWTDSSGRQWTAEVVGLGLEEARRQLDGVTVDGPDVTWQAVDSAWSLIHLRTGDPYVLPTGGTSWTVGADGGLGGRGFDVHSNPEPHVPAAASAWVDDRLTELDGRPAVVSPVRGSEAEGGPPGSPGYITLAVDVEPGVTAISRFVPGDLASVEAMLGSLRQVPPDDPRIEAYGEE